MQEIIDRVKQQLRWAVVQKITENDCEITSDPWMRTHTILVPMSPRPIEHLHELAHATLAERHHLLGTSYFATGTPPGSITLLTWPCRAASDWFADDLLMQWCPDAERAEIREHIGYMAVLGDVSTEAISGGGLMFAQGVKYLGQNVRRIPAGYRPAAKTLLAVDPRKPSIAAKRDLINNLAALTCPLRLELGHEDGVDVWRLADSRSSAAAMGRLKSDRKAASSRKNGRKGGRPKKQER